MLDPTMLRLFTWAFSSLTIYITTECGTADSLFLAEPCFKFQTFYPVLRSNKYS